MTGCLIEWVDSHTIHGWQEPDAGKPLAFKIVSVGILVDEGEEAVAITTSSSENGTRLDQLVIPRAAIVRMKRFEVNS